MSIGSISPEAVGLFREAYIDATGSSFKFTLRPDSLKRRDALQEQGDKRLRFLINQGGGVFPRGSLRYVYPNSRNPGFFEYNLEFNGALVGENGKYNVPYTRSEVRLQRGQDSTVEFTGGVDPTFYLTVAEGIEVFANLARPGRLEVGGELMHLATWFPPLENYPGLFSGPHAGKVIWEDFSKPAS